MECPSRLLACLPIVLALGSGLPASAVAAPPVIGEAVHFDSGPWTLTGSLLLPAGPGPHPAFVALEGSGDASYSNAWQAGYFPFWKDIAEHLVARGYAVLLYNKPGVKDSAGDWQRQSFEDRADEAMAAVGHLATRKEIDPARIGLIGHSQGGWIAQVAGARNPEAVAFLVLLAGPGVPVRQQIRDDMESRWACDQVSRFGLAMRRTGFRLGFGTLGLTARVARPGYLSRIIHFDPRDVLPEIRQPTLALFAGNDPLVPPEPNRLRMERYFGTTHGNTRLIVRIVPEADHFFRTSAFCPGDRRPTEWAPGFFETLEAGFREAFPEPGS